MRRSWVRIPSRPPDSKKKKLTPSLKAADPKINLGDKPLKQTEPSTPLSLSHPGDLLAAVAARPDWTRTTSLVETVTMLRGPKFSSHAVFADERLDTRVVEEHHFCRVSCCLRNSIPCITPLSVHFSMVVSRCCAWSQALAALRMPGAFSEESESWTFYRILSGVPILC